MTLRSLILRTTLLTALCIPAGIFAQSDSIELSTETAETTAFDIIVGGKLAATAIARFGEGWVEIDDPADVIEQLTMVKEPAQLREALTGRIDQIREIPGIARIQVDTDNFRIVLSLDSSIVTAAGGGDARIPDPEDKLSMQQRVLVAASGDYSGDEVSAMTYQTRISRGKMWGKYDAASLSDGTNQVDQLGLFRIIGRFQAGLGFMRTPGQTFGQSLDILGLSFKTSEELLRDQEALRGSTFQIFVPSRSRVEFYRDGRLLSVQVMDFGLQDVDTLAWPQGSYEVEVVIREDNGAVSTDRRFFAKSGFLALSEHPVYTLDVGTKRDKYEVDDTPVYQTGIRFRAAPMLELNGSVYGTDGITIGSTGAVLVFRDLTANLGASISSRSEYGLETGISGELLGLSWSGNWSRAYSDEAPPETELITRPGATPIPVPVAGQLNLLSSRRQSLSGSVQRQFGDVVVKFSGNRNVSTYQEERYAYGPGLEWRIINSAETALTATVNAFHTDDGDRGEAFIALRRTFLPWSIQSQLSGRSESGKQIGKLNTQAVYDRRSQSGKGIRAVIQNESGNDSGDEQTSTVNGGNIDYGGDYLGGSAFLRDLRGTDNDGTAYGVNAQSSVVLSQDLHPAVARPSSYEAVFIGEVTSDTSDSAFEVLVNDQVYETIKPGERAVIGLTPFRTYRLAVRPAKESAIMSYDNSVKTVTVFPGNIVRQTWGAEKVFIALGTLVNENGEPIGYERIRGAKGYVFTEADGSFQAEITGKDELRIESPRRKCTIQLPEKERGEYFTDYGTVPCR